MHSTLKGRVPHYVGADLTDRYSKRCRDVDVCGLMPNSNGKLTVSFWSWSWDRSPEPLDVTAIIKELGRTRATMLDGPQALAAGGALRACEKEAAAAAKTPQVPPVPGVSFAAGFVCSSLDLFAALAKAGAQISPSGFIGGVSEVYPGHIWRILARGVLPKKSTRKGRLVRKRILEALGVSDLPALPTHDQNDACIAAVLAAAADNVVPGIAVRGIGMDLFEEPDGTLREGLMVIPELSARTVEAVSRVARM
jgi:hypothetical protein